jgi:hypothetical protein
MMLARHLLLVATLSYFPLGGQPLSALDQGIIERPDSVTLDRSSTVRWQALFSVNPAWINRQIAFLETRQPDLSLSLLLGRLLYRGEAWTRRESDLVIAQQWRQDNLKVKQTILRALRTHHNPDVVNYICHYLTIEQEPTLVISALGTLAILDANTAPSWAYRLSDPRVQPPLPGSTSSTVRQQALEYLFQTKGIESADTRKAFDWALLRVTGSERNNAIRLLSHTMANDMRHAVALKLISEYRSGVIDGLGKQGLVMVIGDLSGDADVDMVNALMELVINGERAVATTAATALATSLSWDAPVAINDLITRSQQDPDPVVRQALTALLIRLDPDAVAVISPTTSPWAALANHHHLLQQWSAPNPLHGAPTQAVPATIPSTVP